MALLRVLRSMPLAVESASLKREQKLNPSPGLAAGMQRGKSRGMSSPGLCFTALFPCLLGVRGASSVYRRENLSLDARKQQQQICRSTVVSFKQICTPAPSGQLPKCFHALDSSGCFPSTPPTLPGPESLHLACPACIKTILMLGFFFSSFVFCVFFFFLTAELEISWDLECIKGRDCSVFLRAEPRPQPLASLPPFDSL